MAPVTADIESGDLTLPARDLSSPPDIWRRSDIGSALGKDDNGIDLLSSAPVLADSDLNPTARDAVDGAPRLLAVRQDSNTQPIIVPATYMNSKPGANSGEVAGIVLGVVFGIILVLWILATLTNNPFRPVVGTSSVIDRSQLTRAEEEAVVGTSRRTRRTRTKSGSRSKARSGSRGEEVTEVRRVSGGRSPRRARETIIVEETRRSSRPPPDVYEEDVVEVIEEESDLSHRPRRSSGYRNVDPDEYGGGSRPMRKVRR